MQRKPSSSTPQAVSAEALNLKPSQPAKVDTGPSRKKPGVMDASDARDGAADQSASATDDASTAQQADAQLEPITVALADIDPASADGPANITDSTVDSTGAYGPSSSPGASAARAPADAPSSWDLGAGLLVLGGLGLAAAAASGGSSGGSVTTTPTTPITSPVVAPTIATVQIAQATGAQNQLLNAGDTVSVNVKFSEVVLVNGVPQVDLVVGNTVVKASYASGNGTDTLTFTYTIAAGENDADGIAISANAVSLNGGSITGQTSHAAATITSVAVADDGAYMVDTTPPPAPVITGFRDVYTNAPTSGPDLHTTTLGAVLMQKDGAGGLSTWLDGTAEAGAAVSVTLAPGHTVQVLADANGNWAHQLTLAEITAMGVGNETLSASVSDAAGNTATGTLDVLINAQAMINGAVASGGYGSAYVDALVYGGAGWDHGVITYSFATNPLDPNSVWSASEKAAFVLATQLISDVANVRFVEGVFSADVTGATNMTLAKIPQASMSLPGALGEFTIPYAYLLGPSSEFNYPLEGKFGYDAASWADLTPGSTGFYTLVHELLHGMGLTHPFDGSTGQTQFPGVGPGAAGSTGDFGLNQGIWSTMSYVFDWDKEPADASGNWGLPSGPMVFDIAALQELYGANTDFHTGADSYRLPGSSASGTGWSCIWDAGGADTLSNSGSLADCVINLNAYPDAGGIDPTHYVSHVFGINGGYTIADGVLIENAIGGGGMDTIYGNALANRLTGGARSDEFHFVSAPSATNVDVITDMSGLEGDVIVLDKSVFTALNGLPHLLDNFRLASAANVGGDDYVVYDDTTGNVYYDATGTGSGASGVLFATLESRPNDITAICFSVI